MSSKPSGLRGYPSAFAMASHIAITSGVRTIDGFSSGTSGRSASKLSSRPHSEEAGDQADRLVAALGDPLLRDAGGLRAALDEDRLPRGLSCARR